LFAIVPPCRQIGLPADLVACGRVGRALAASLVGTNRQFDRVPERDALRPTVTLS